MIVDPDFLDHWKTRMLVDLLGEDEFAPLYLIRLWAHCQHRRSWVFTLPPAALKAVCRFKGDAEAFESAMTASGFIARSGDNVAVTAWDEYNASLIANWKNGQRGGRPKKSKDIPPEGDQKTHGFPMDNPSGTHGEPIRGDRIGGDKNPPIPPKGGESETSSKKSAIALKTFLEHCRKSNDKPIPEGDPVFDYADEVGLPLDYLRLHWLEFKERYCMVDAKRYKDWRSVYRKSVRGNWFRLWFIRDGQCGLTTQGEQARRHHKEAA